MGVTIHFIDANFCLRSYLLDVKELLDNHTGENIAEHLSEIMNDWHLSSIKLSGVTTDNGSNTHKAVDTLHWCHMPCFSHTLQLAVQVAMKLSAVAMKLSAVSRAIARCKRLINHFQHSVQSTLILRSKQKSLKHPQHSLIQEVSTRWNSSYYMMERIIMQQQPICATLLEIKGGDLMPSEEEFAAMESFIKILKLLVEITETMGGQKWVTISAVHPFLYKLLHISFNTTSNDTHLEKSIKESLKNNLSGRYSGKTIDLLNKACFLDPRFRSLSFLTAEEKEVVIDGVFDEMLMTNIRVSGSTNENVGPKPKKSKLLLGDVFEHTSSPSLTPQNAAKKELDQYKTEEPVIENPLEWWKKIKNSFLG